MERQTRGWLAAALMTALLLAAGLAAAAQEAAREDFKIEIDGKKTWSVRYGVGDAYGLALVGATPYQLSLDQTLAVDIAGEALSILTINAHFNDQQPTNLQSITVGLNAGDLTGVFGDFALSGQEAFAVYNKKLKGGRLDYRMGGATLTGVLSQIEGISESKTFVGTAAKDEVLFARYQADAPWTPAPYGEHLDGLFHYLLRTRFIEDFSAVRLALAASEGLARFLEMYDLGYLVPTLEVYVPDDLASGVYTAVPAEDGDILLLRSDPRALGRTRVKDLIRAYNDENGLSGTARKTYPFNEDTAYEAAFLEKLSAFASVVVDEESYALDSAGRRRFYDLGRREVKEDSVVVEVSLDGGTFRSIADPDLADYRAIPYGEQGVIEFLFPAAFFAGERNQVRVAFDYAISGGAFSLGLSLVQGSEKVYLNGTLLARDVDYSIDYELGVLVLFATVSETDELRIDYERFRGGLGGGTEYASNFYGLSLDWPYSDALAIRVSLLQAADSPRPLVDPERARTMPNRHTVGGVIGTLDLEDFTASLTLGANEDRFPFDDNARANLPNQVTGLLLLPPYTFITHLGGLSVEQDGIWSSYDASDGLSASRVYGLVTDGENVFFATASGLTVVALEGESPLDRVGNWTRYGQPEGLPSATVLAVALLGNRLWVGTEGGLASVATSEMDDPERWTVYSEAALAEMGAVTALAGDEETLYIGAEEGLYVLDRRTGDVEAIEDMTGIAVRALLLDQGTLYVACDRGLRAVRDGTGTGWLEWGRPVYAVASEAGRLVWGTDDGLERLGEARLLSGETVTAVAFSEDGRLWAGTRADAAYRLLLAEVSDSGVRAFEGSELGIDGRDRARFADIPAEEHTDRGLIGRFQFERDLGEFSVVGTFESVSPEFTGIGRLGRSDSLGWAVSSKGVLFGGVAFSASHGYHLRDRASDPSSALENGISLDWTFGPRATLTLEQSAVDDDPFISGFESGRISYGLSVTDRLFGDALAVALKWRDAFTMQEDEAPQRSNQLSLDGTWKPISGLSITVGGSRPVSSRRGQVSGSERGSLQADWSLGLPLADATAHYDATARRSLGEAGFEIAHTGKLDLTGAQFDVLGFAVTPTAGGSASWEEGVVSSSGQATVRATAGGLSLRGTYGVDVSGWGEPTERRTERLSVGADYSGLPDWKPSLSYTDTTTSANVGGAARISRNQVLNGRVLWAPRDGPRDDLSLSVRGVTRRDDLVLTATLRNTLTVQLLETVGGRLDFTGSFRSADGESVLDLALKAGADLRVTEMWSGSLLASIQAGRKASGGLYLSGVIELFVAATF